MSRASTLRDTCVRKTCHFLKCGMWDECIENPFSCMPVSIVHDLLSHIWTSRSPLSTASIADSRLLLTSGRLENFVLPLVEKDGDYTTLLRMLSCGCQNLRTLSVLLRDNMGRGRNVDGVSLQELLQNCTKLQCLHSSIYFELNDLRNCSKLKTLRLHFDMGLTEMFSRRITSDLLKLLHSVEEFALCRHNLFLSEDDELRLTCAILENCPQLISLGFHESSAALKELHDRDIRTLGFPSRFQLRRCHWDGVRRGQYKVSRDKYCERIRVAALSCPLLEVLVIHVLDAACLRHLRTLRSLTCLVMYFYGYEDDSVQEFYSLLDGIGSQLRQLSVYEYGKFRKPLSVNFISAHCPNLNTLELDCQIVADKRFQPCISLLNLKHLRVCRNERKSLVFLLSNCLHLKVLCLHSCWELEVRTLQAILRKNPLAELEVALICGLFLSELGWKRFLQSAVKLQSCCLASFTGINEDMRRVRDLNSTVVYHSDRGFDELSVKQFPLSMNNSCWL